MKIDCPTEWKTCVKCDKRNDYIICCHGGRVDTVENTGDDDIHFLGAMCSNEPSWHTQQCRPVKIEWSNDVESYNLVTEKVKTELKWEMAN